MQSNNAYRVTGIILAGGAGARVDHRDKGLISWRGKPLIEHVRDRIAPQVGRLVISCNRNSAFYARYADQVVCDSRDGHQGPLAGLEAAEPHIDSPLLLVTPCDAPLLPTNLASRLIAALQADSSGRIQVSYAHDGSRKQYLFAALRRGCLDALPDYLDRGERSVRDWYAELDAVEVCFKDHPEDFRNFNTEAELGR